GQRQLHLIATPKSELVNDPVAGAQHEGMLGIGTTASLSEIRHVHYGPVPAVAEATTRTWRMVTTTVYYLGRMVTGQVSALGAEGAPTVGAMLVGDSVNLIQIAAMISVSLGFMNLLPLPVLDG